MLELNSLVRVDSAIDLSKVEPTEKPMAMCLVHWYNKVLFIPKSPEALKQEEMYLIRGVEVKDSKRPVNILPEGIVGIIQFETIAKGVVRIVEEQARVEILHSKDEPAEKNLKLHGKIYYMNEEDSRKQVVYVYSAPFGKSDVLDSLTWIEVNKLGSLDNTRPDIWKIVRHIFSQNMRDDTFELNVLYNKNRTVGINLVNTSELKRQTEALKKEKLIY